MVIVVDGETGIKIESNPHILYSEQHHSHLNGSCYGKSVGTRHSIALPS